MSGAEDEKVVPATEPEVAPEPVVKDAVPEDDAAAKAAKKAAKKAKKAARKAKKKAKKEAAAAKESSGSEEESEEEEEEEETDFNKLSEREKAKAIRKLYLETAAEDDDNQDGSTDESDDDDIQGPHKKQRILQELATGADSTLHRALDEEREAREAKKLLSEIENKFGEVGDEMDRVRAEQRKTGRVREVPQEQLLPTVRDPKLWAVKCDPTHETEVILLLMRKYNMFKNTNRPMFINAAFAAPHSQGYVYIEADKKVHVEQACKDIRMLKGWQIKLVPITQMVQSLEVQVTNHIVKKGDWGRFKRGVFSGDLCQVHRTKDQGTAVTVKLVPRIDFAGLEHKSAGSKRKRKSAIRPPQRLFDENEIRNLGGEVVRDNRGDFFKFQNNFYKNGFLYKTCKANLLSFDEIRPTTEEVERFHSELTPEDRAKVNSLVDGTGLSKNVLYNKGDRIIVVEGDLANLTGRVITMQDRNTVIVDLDEKSLREYVPFLTSDIKKYFMVNDHVKVLSGIHKGETGLVIQVRVAEEIAVLLSDLSNSQLEVPMHTIVESSEYASGADTLGEYALMDLVQIDERNQGCIIKVDLSSFQVLDTYGVVRQIPLKEMGKKLFNRNSATMDKNQNQLSQGDIVRIVDGPHRNIQGTVKHVVRQFIFVHSMKTDKNGGVLCIRGANCMLMGQPKATTIGGFAGGMSPRVGGTGPGSYAKPARMQTTRFNNDPLLNKSVTVTGGQYKGWLGICRSTDGNHYQVELHAIRKTVTVPCNKVVLAASSRPAPAPERDVFLGGRTPAYNMGGKTPMHDGGLTPHTPFHGGRTPSMTPSSDIWAATPRVRSNSSMDTSDDHDPEAKAPDAWDMMQGMGGDEYAPSDDFSVSNNSSSSSSSSGPRTNNTNSQDWVPGTVVSLPDGTIAVLSQKNADQWTLSSGTVMTTSQLRTVSPSKQDLVIIITGTKTGVSGTVLGTDVKESGAVDVFVEVPNGEDMEIVSIDHVVKYDPSVLL